jgi:hypothetical protein
VSLAKFSDAFYFFRPKNYSLAKAKKSSKIQNAKITPNYGTFIMTSSRPVTDFTDTCMHCKKIMDVKLRKGCFLVTQDAYEAVVAEMSPHEFNIKMRTTRADVFDDRWLWECARCQRRNIVPRNCLEAIAKEPTEVAADTCVVS